MQKGNGAAPAKWVKAKVERSFGYTPNAAWKRDRGVWPEGGIWIMPDGNILYNVYAYEEWAESEWAYRRQHDAPALPSGPAA